VREQVEVLEHHADIAANLLNKPDIVTQLFAIHHNSTALVFFKAVDAANGGGFAGTRRTTNDNAFALLDGEVDVFEDMKSAIPFMDAFHLNHGLLG
jgi:hypothetical protein